MAKFYSSAYLKGGRNRPDGQNSGSTAVTTVTIPKGVALAIGDILYFGKLGETVKLPKFELRADKFDTNATATLAGKLGITASDACLLATATVIQTNTTGAKNIAAVDGLPTGSGNTFAVTPFPSQATVQDLIFTVTAAAATADVSTNRNITLEFDYQYDYPSTYLTGVSDPKYPFAGSKVFDAAVIDDYAGNAP